MFALGLGEQEIKIAVFERVLLCLWFCVVNFNLSKFLWVVMGVRGVNGFTWELKIGIAPR